MLIDHRLIIEVGFIRLGKRKSVVKNAFEVQRSAATFSSYPDVLKVINKPKIGSVDHIP